MRATCTQSPFDQQVLNFQQAQDSFTQTFQRQREQTAGVSLPEINCYYL